MQILSVTALTLLSASLTLADEWQPSAASLACLYMTNDYNWKGEGQNICQVGGQCSNSLPDGLSKNVSSAGPPPGMTCFLYDAENCGGTGSAPIVNPGYANLSDPVINFNKRALSWKCYKYCGYMSSSSSSSASSTQHSTVITVTVTSTSTSATHASITNTVGSAAVSSSSVVRGPSPGAQFPNGTATVLTHTFADGSTELTTLVIATPT